jgi:hypothetical protein
MFSYSETATMRNGKQINLITQIHSVCLDEMAGAAALSWCPRHGRGCSQIIREFVYCKARHGQARACGRCSPGTRSLGQPKYRLVLRSASATQQDLDGRLYNGQLSAWVQLTTRQRNDAKIVRSAEHTVLLFLILAGTPHAVRSSCPKPHRFCVQGHVCETSPGNMSMGHVA